MITIEYRLIFRSDFHIGSGTGIPGIIDKGLKYDVNGIPEINGKTIKGVVRDSVENITYINKERNTQILDSLFGQEGRDITCFNFATPEIEHQYINRIKNDKFLQKNISTIQPHNAIARETLVAKKGALFFNELAPYTLVYQGKISQTRDVDERIESKVLYYLISGLRFVTHLGGNRRRGNGLVRFELYNVKKGPDTLDWKEIIKGRGLNRE